MEDPFLVHARHSKKDKVAPLSKWVVLCSGETNLSSSVRLIPSLSKSVNIFLPCFHIFYMSTHGHFHSTTILKIPSKTLKVYTY